MQEILDKFFSDKLIRQRVFLYGGSLINFGYATVKIIAGMIFRSLWLSFMGGYYLILGCFRLVIIHFEQKYKEADNLSLEYKRYKNCGFILAFLDLFMVYIISMAVQFKAVVIYPGSLIYGMALYAFVSMGFAIKNLVTIRTIHRPLYGASRVASQVSALISMLSLEIAMLSRFGADRTYFRITMIIISGTAIFIIVGAMAIRMIYVGETYSKEENVFKLINSYKKRLLLDKEKKERKIAIKLEKLERKKEIKLERQERKIKKEEAKKEN